MKFVAKPNSFPADTKAITKKEFLKIKAGDKITLRWYDSDETEAVALETTRRNDCDSVKVLYKSGDTDTVYRDQVTGVYENLLIVLKD